MSFAKNSLSVFGTRIFLISISIISSIIVTRVLGPFNRGVMEILILMPYLLVSFGNLGIGNANLYFIGKKKYSIAKIASNSLSLSFILGISLVLIAYIFFYFCRKTLFTDVPFYFTYLVFSLIPLLLFQKYIQYTLLGKEEITTRNIIVLLPAAMNFVLTIFLVLVIRLSILGVLIALLASNLFAFALCYYFISKRTQIRLSFDFRLLIDSVRFGIIPFLALLVMNLIFKADIFIIKFYMDSTAVGLYSLAVTVVEKIWLLPEAVGLVLFARVSNSSEKNANALTPVICRMSLLCSIVLAFILFISARFLVPFVYGTDFSASVEPLLILLPGIVSMTLYMILHSDLTGRGKAKITLYIFTVAFVLNIILNILFIPVLGLNGAAMASTISYTLGSVGLGIAFTKATSTSFMTLILPQKADFTAYLIPLVLKCKSYAGRVLS